MALRTYTELQVAVGLWLNRQDLNDAIPDFIALGEAANNRRLRVLQMEGRDSGLTDGATIAVPDDWLETRTLRLASPTAGQQILEYVGEEEWDRLEASGLTGTTRYYTIINGAFQVLPAPSSNLTYALRYYQTIPPLSENGSNWLLVKSPDLYLYGSLLGAEAYLKDDDRLPIWKGIRDEIMSDMMLESERAKRSTTRLVSRRQSYG